MEGYEKFKKDVYNLTTIDLNAYKEKQMRRRIDTLITKNNKTSYDDYVRLIKSDKEKFEQFINFLTINVSEFYRNPEQWTVLEKELFPALIQIGQVLFQQAGNFNIIDIQLMLRDQVQQKVHRAFKYFQLK